MDREGAARQRFERLTAQLGEGDTSPSPRREGFGTGSLFVGRKMFGLLGDSGALVLKLPPARVQALIDEGLGAPWHPGTGKPLKEYVSIAFARQARWLALAKESREYMRSRA